MKPAVAVAAIAGGVLLIVAARNGARPSLAGTAVPDATAAPIRTADAATSAAATSAAATAAASAEVRSLDADLNRALGREVRGGRWGAIVVSLTRGDTLFTRSADRLMQPASTLKLFTTGLAFDRFGPSYQLHTDVLRDADVSADGTLKGNLYLRGGGDPALSSRFLGRDASPTDQLASAIVLSGIRHVSGDIVADASAFEGDGIPSGWRRRYLSATYAAPVSALSINENVAWVAVTPSGDHATLALQPASTVFHLINNVTARPGSRGESIVVYRRGTDELEVRGWIGTLSPTRRYTVVLKDPPRFAAGALRASLEAHGVTVDGDIREGVTPPSAAAVASLKSPPLAQIISAMNRESINHVAELLFRDAARAASPDHVGSVETGRAALDNFLVDKVGVPALDVRVADGSGLSVRDSVTPRAMVSLLAYAHHAPWASAFHSSLPVAGESELLEDRMRRTSAQGNLHAKTGTTNTVVSLAGYVTAVNGEILAFAMIYNGPDRWNARAAMDRSGVLLASFARQ